MRGQVRKKRHTGQKDEAGRSERGETQARKTKQVDQKEEADRPEEQTADQREDAHRPGAEVGSQREEAGKSDWQGLCCRINLSLRLKWE